MNHKLSLKPWIRQAACLLLVAAASSPALRAQDFSSGSTGADGALSFPPNAGTIVFNPSTLGIDPERDNIFHFTTITIPAGTTIRLGADILGQGRGVVWLASGDVTITGALNLDGSQGHNNNILAAPSIAGAGGFNGGVGSTSAVVAPRGGSGPGGGGAQSNRSGGSAGHISAGGTAANTAAAGTAYGSALVLPLVGGSGGGGGGFNTGPGPGGGAGGGAILIASSTRIHVPGSISARGGAAGGPGLGWLGGTGSGGAIRLMAGTVSGQGSLNVSAPTGTAPASPGRVRLEAHQLLFDGFITPTASGTTASPGSIFLPASAPRVRVVRVAGVNVAENPAGGFVAPDVVIDFAQPVSLEIEAANIPPGTQVRLTLVPENGTTIVATSTPLVGTREISTATVGPLTFPHGFSKLSINATWTP